MDDTLKNLALAFLSLLVVNGKLQKRVEHDAARQVREAFANTGSVTARVDAGGLFGLTTNSLGAVDIYGSHLRSDRLPFYLYPKAGWKGSIRHLRLHFDDFTLAGLPVERFEANIPNARYDLGHALYRHRLQLRSAGEGWSQVTVGAAGLQTFINRKYQDTLSDVTVVFKSGKLAIQGKLSLFSQRLPLTATGKLIPREGRYVDLIEPVISVNGAPLSPAFSGSLLSRINPVLDSEKDLGLAGFFRLTDVEVGASALFIRGRVTIPIAPDALPIPHN